MRITHLTRTAKSAKGMIALTLFSALAVFGVTGMTLLGATAKPAFSVSATPASQTVTAGQGITYAVKVTRDNKFTSPVALSVPNLPPRMSASFLPNPVPGSSTVSSLQVNTNVGGTTNPGTYTFTIRGTSGSATSSTNVTLTVVAASQPNFSLSATPSTLTISDDDEVTYSLDINRSGGFTGPVALSVSGLPKEISAQFAPNPASGNSASFTVTTLPKPKPGSYTLTITGSGSSGQIVRSTAVQLVVEEKKPFLVTGSPSRQLSPGDAVPFDLTLRNPHNFTLRITEVAVAVDRNTSDPGCDGEDNYSVLPIPASKYPLMLPAHATRTLGDLGLTADADKPRVTMNDLATVNQDACRGATVYFHYTGRATR